jgi:hypothetical protein
MQWVVKNQQKVVGVPKDVVDRFTDLKYILNTTCILVCGKDGISNGDLSHQYKVCILNAMDKELKRGFSISHIVDYTLQREIRAKDTVALFLIVHQCKNQLISV